jgi:uncharacterized protein YecE (DUF72 family)
MKSIHIGTAGWNVPTALKQQFEAVGSHLERYASKMNSAEVNSSFYKPHQRETWQRWAESTPPDFKFAVKAPKAITHTAKLVNCGHLLVEFFDQISGLEEKLGPVLFQLPPSYSFAQGVTRDFLGTLREVHAGPVALEPRNATWFTTDANRLLREFNIARVAADPAKGSSSAAHPAGASSLRYYRLHGSPRVYWSAYDTASIKALATQLIAHESGDSWVVFDNTAAGEALKNALELQALLSN